MTKPIPTVQKYMTTTPLTIGREQTIERAAAMMSENRVRHLPVLEGGHLVGVLSERDVAMIQNLAGVDPKIVRVEEAMSLLPYAVAPDAPLDVVVSEMAEKRIGSAVVMQNAKVVGIFTAVDAMTALAVLLRTRLGN